MVSRTPPIILNNLMSVNDAALHSGYNPQYLRRLLRSGQLTGLKVGQVWLIDLKGLDCYLTNALNSTDHRFSPK